MSEASATAPETAKPAETQWPIKFPLRKAILSDGEPVNEVSLREPTAGDIERAGCPVNVDFGFDPPKVTFDEPKMAAMMATLASVPPSSIRAMNPKDWSTIAWSIAGFFLPDMGTE